MWISQAISHGFYQKRNELIDRKYYSGFLGVINKCKSSKVKYSNLVVNLRCMNIDSDIITLFAGGGITENLILKKNGKKQNWKINTLKRFFNFLISI